jgi:cyclophilin family peptidyl-prolyl cis-trans isomerase
VANYTSGSGTTSLTFNYNVAAGQNTADLDYASTAALTLNGGSIQDAAGNAAVLTLPATGTDGLATQQIVIDTTPPAVTAVSSTQAAGVYAAGTTVPITVNFGEAVTVMGTPQLSLNDGAVANYTSGSGTTSLTFNYNVAAGQNTADLDYASTSALSLNGGSIQDAAGNAAVPTLPATGTDGLATRQIVIDTTPRTVTGVLSTQAVGTYAAGTTIPITVTFGEAVTVTGTPQLTLNDGAVANYVRGSGTASLTFNYDVAAGQNTADLDYASTAALTLNGGSIQDAAGNAALLTLPATGTDGLATQQIVIDTTPPAVTAVSSTQAAGAYAAGTTVPITVTFGDAVTVTGTPQLTLNDGAVANYVSGSGTASLTFNYDVAAAQNTADLDYASAAALTLNGGSIQDAAGNAALLTLPATGTDGLATQQIVIDTTPPAVTAVSSTQAAGAYAAGTTVPITVTFGEAVNVTGTPQLTLNDGAVANYTSGNGTASLSFSYVVTAGENTANLDYASTDALALNGGSIQDAAGNTAVLTLPATGTDGLATQQIVIDTTPPAVTVVSSTQAAGAYAAGTTVPITVTFGEAVTVTGTPQLTLNDGSVANYTSGNGTASLSFSYVVTTGENTADLDYASAAALVLNGGGIQDVAGNTALLTLPATGTDGLATQQIVIDTTPRTVTGVSSTQAAGVYGAGTTIPITVTFGEAVTVTGTPQLTLNDGAVANYISGSGTASLSFSYVVATGDNTADLDYASTSALVLNGGGIQDAAGNAALLTLPATGTDGLAIQQIVIDTTPPAVAAVSSTQAAGVYAAGTTVPITVTFDKLVTVTGAPQLTLNDGAVATYVSGSGTASLTFTYSVAAGQNTADLDYASTDALVLNGVSIQDAAGNAALLTLPATGTDGLASQQIIIDTTPPAVTAVSSTQAAGVYGAGITVPITVAFGNAVTVTGTPQLMLNDGAVASYASGSGTELLTFDYHVAAGETTADLDFASTGALALNGGSIQDAAGNAAVLTLPATGTDGLATRQIVIDTTPPTVAAVSSTQAAGTYAAGTTVPITVTFDKAVTVTGTPQLTLNDGAVVSYISGSGTESLTFDYNVVAGQNTADLDYASTGALMLNGGSIQDVAGNAAVLTLPATGTDGLATQQIVIDTTLPTGYSISANQSLLNASDSQSAGITLDGGTNGDTYQYTISSNGGAATVTGSGSVTSNSQSIAPINVSSLADGTLTYSVTLTSADGNTGAAVTTTAILDQTSPAGYTIAAVPAALNATTDTAAGFQFTAAEVGMTYQFSISSSGGGSPITGSGNVTSATQSVTGINVSSLSDGSLTYSVTLTDSAGHVGAAATASGVLERVAPSGYTITANQATIDNASSTDAGFTFSGAELNTTYDYTITSSGGSGSVTGSGTVTSATEQVTGIDVSSLPNGTLTFSVTLTDQAGNTGAAATATATLSLLALTSTPPTSATVGQVYTYTVQTNALSGDTVTVTPGTTLPTGMSFDATTQTFTWTPTADQAGTSPSFTATVTDTTLNNTITLGPIFVAVAAADGLTVIAPPASMAIGSPALIAFDSTNANPTFTVSTSDSSALTATLMPQTNQVLEIDTNLGDMEFQLLNNYTPNTVSHFVNLVDSNTYTNTSFYRIIQSFMIQGGSGGTGSAIPDELNADLRFTTSGLLAMANDGVDGNTSEFFITSPDDTSNGFLDFRYTIFGKLISGDNVRQAIAATPVTTNSSGEDSQPLTPVTIYSMSVTTETDAGVLLLNALPGASGSYTVTVSDGSPEGTTSFTVNIGANSYDPPNPWVQPINSTDTINVAANGQASFIPTGGYDAAAGAVAPQVSVQLLRDVPQYPTYYVDNSYTGTSPDAPANPDIALAQNGSSYTVTPTAGYYGEQFLEVMGFTPVSGTFELEVGSTTTGPISFDSTDLAATAANIQDALISAGFGGAIVSVDAGTTAPNFSFDVTFPGSEAQITYVSAASDLPVTFTNSASAAAASQELTFAATGASWDSGTGVNPVYRAFVPVYVAPPTPQIASISVGGQTVTGSTSANNSSTATELSFNITGAISGATVSVYIDGDSTPIATGTVASGATSITLTTDGTTTIAGGNHEFIVQQSIATPAVTLLADWSDNSSPGVEFAIPASSVTSAASAGTELTIGST